MMKLTAALFALLLINGTVWCEEIVQAGSLSGGTGHNVDSIVLEQFDDLGGSRSLNFVELDLLTSTVGGGMTNGSGIPVNISVRLAADYWLGTQLLAMTEALIDLDVPNTGSPSAFSVFNTDTEQVFITQPADLAAWIGSGDITLTGVTDFEIALTPPGGISFSAGGTVNYTLVYDFDAGPQAYCSAKTSSAGCVAAISTSNRCAHPTSGASDYSLIAAQVQELKNGLLFAGINGPANIPFSGGVLCVQPPTKRGPIISSGGDEALQCDGSFSTLVNDGNLIPSGLDAAPGQSAWYQYWYRDPLNGPGQLGTALSDAIQLDFQ